MVASQQSWSGRLPEQEPSKSSISQTAFIQRNPANLSKVTKKDWIYQRFSED